MTECNQTTFPFEAQRFQQFTSVPFLLTTLLRLI